MPTNAWLVYGESGDTLIINRTHRGQARLRLLQGERVVSAVLPARKLRDALGEFLLHEMIEHTPEVEEEETP